MLETIGLDYIAEITIKWQKFSRLKSLKYTVYCGKVNPHEVTLNPYEVTTEHWQIWKWRETFVAIFDQLSCCQPSFMQPLPGFTKIAVMTQQFDTEN